MCFTTFLFSCPAKVLLKWNWVSLESSNVSLLISKFLCHFTNYFSFICLCASGNVTDANVAQLKTLNMIALPVRYSEKFYRELVEKSPPEYLKFAFWSGFAVGSVCSRLEAQEDKSNKIYIMTIGVIPAYRRRGIGEQENACYFISIY